MRPSLRWDSAVVPRFGRMSVCLFVCLFEVMAQGQFGM